MKRNLLLVLASLLLTYTLLEGTFLYWYPRVVPTAVAMSFPEAAVRPLLQTSKASAIPSHYLAILGDSYAEGAGDWASAELSKPRARYHSAHVLQDLAGLDVISFGSSGAGSVRGIVTRPLGIIPYIRRYLASDFPDPDVVLVYFYEGNDLNENLNYFLSSFPPIYPQADPYDAAAYHKYLQAFAVDGSVSYYLATHDEWLRHRPLLQLIVSQLKKMAGVPVEKVSVPGVGKNLPKPWIPPVTHVKLPGEINKARIGDAVVQLPDQLQAPPMDLTDSELKQAWFAFEQSVRFTAQALPRSRFVLVYIPSVMMCYDMAGEEVSRQPYDRAMATFNWTAVREKNQHLRHNFALIAQRLGLPVIDTTDKLRSTARQAPLHGPGDWNHFNRLGYETLAGAIAPDLEELLQTPKK